MVRRRAICPPGCVDTGLRCCSHWRVRYHRPSSRVKPARPCRGSGHRAHRRGAAALTGQGGPAILWALASGVLTSRPGRICRRVPNTRREVRMDDHVVRDTLARGMRIQANQEAPDNRGHVSYRPPGEDRAYIIGRLHVLGRAMSSTTYDDVVTIDLD